VGLQNGKGIESLFRYIVRKASQNLEKYTNIPIEEGQGCLSDSAPPRIHKDIIKLSRANY
jgi:hypothetical protein